MESFGNNCVTGHSRESGIQRAVWIPACHSGAMTRTPCALQPAAADITGQRLGRMDAGVGIAMDRRQHVGDIAMGIAVPAIHPRHQTGVAEAMDSAPGRIEEIAATVFGKLLAIGLLAASLSSARRASLPATLAYLAILAGGAAFRIAFLAAGDCSARRPDISLRFAQAHNLPRMRGVPILQRRGAPPFPVRIDGAHNPATSVAAVEGHRTDGYPGHQFPHRRGVPCAHARIGDIGARGAGAAAQRDRARRPPPGTVRHLRRTRRRTAQVGRGWQRICRLLRRPRCVAAGA